MNKSIANGGGFTAFLYTSFSSIYAPWPSIPPKAFITVKHNYKVKQVTFCLKQTEKEKLYPND